jgi:predicted O-methyltransferase YrrM
MKHIANPAAQTPELYFTLQQEFKKSLLDTYGTSGGDSESLIQHAVDGSIKLLDAIALRDLLRFSRPQRVLEIGSYLGFSTRWILESTVDLPSCRVTSLDPRVRHRIFDDLKKHVQGFNRIHANRLEFVDAYLSEANLEMFLHDYLNYAPKLTRDRAVEYLGSIPVINKPFANFDFAFIDGDHSFDATVKNLTLVASMMPDGGLIVVHDAISWPDVAPAVQQVTRTQSGLEFVGIVGSGFDEYIAQHSRWSGDCAGGQLSLLERLKGRLTQPQKRQISWEHTRSLCNGLAVVTVGKSDEQLN